MKKPVFIRFFGWAFWFLVSLGFGLVLADDFMHAQGHVSMWGIIAWAFAVPSLVVWMVGTFVYAVSSAHAKQQAQTMAQVLRQAQQPAGVCGFPGPDNLRCDLPAGHHGQHRAAKAGPRAVMTSPLGLTGTDRQ